MRERQHEIRNTEGKTRTAPPTQEYRPWCSSQVSLVSSPSRFSSSRKPFVSASHAGMQYSAGKPGGQVALYSCAALPRGPVRGTVGVGAEHGGECVLQTADRMGNLCVSGGARPCPQRPCAHLHAPSALRAARAATD